MNEIMISAMQIVAQEITKIVIKKAKKRFKKGNNENKRSMDKKSDN